MVMPSRNSAIRTATYIFFFQISLFEADMVFQLETSAELTEAMGKPFNSLTGLGIFV